MAFIVSALLTLMRENYFKNDSVEMWLENGVIHAIHSAHVTVTIEIAKENVANRLKYVNLGKTYPFFADVRLAKTMTKEARTYLSSEEGIRGISAGAFLIKTQLEALIVNLFLNFGKLPVPTKIFNKKREALDWLEQFKRIN